MLIDCVLVIRCRKYCFTDNLPTIVTENSVVACLPAGCVLVLIDCVLVIRCGKNCLAELLIANGALLYNIPVLITVRILFVYNPRMCFLANLSALGNLAALGAVAHLFARRRAGRVLESHPFACCDMLMCFRN